MPNICYEISIEYQGESPWWNFNNNNFYQKGTTYRERSPFKDYKTAVYAFFKTIEIVKKKYPTYTKVYLHRHVTDVTFGFEIILTHYHDFEFPQPNLFDDEDYNFEKEEATTFFKKIKNILKLKKE